MDGQSPIEEYAASKMDDFFSITSLRFLDRPMLKSLEDMIFLGRGENILEYFLVWTKLRFTRKFNYSKNSEQFSNFRKFTAWCVWIIVHNSSNGTFCIEWTGLNLFEIAQSSLESRNQKTFPTFSHLSNKFKTGIQKLKSEKIVTS